MEEGASEATTEEAAAEAEVEPKEGAESEAPKEGEGSKGAKDYSRQFAALSRKDKAVRERESAIEKRELERQRDWEELETYRRLRAQAPQNAEAWLRAGGLDHDKVSNYYKQPGQTPVDHRLQGADTRLAQLEKTLAERDEQLKQAFRQVAQGRYLDKIERQIDADPEAYELLRAEGRATDVFTLIQQYHEKTNQELSVKEACDILEETLLAEREADAKRFRGYKKLAPRLGWETPAAPQPGNKAPAAPKKPTGKTISHASAPASGPTAKQQEAPMTPEEKWERLMERHRTGAKGA